MDLSLSPGVVSAAFFVFFGVGLFTFLFLRSFRALRTWTTVLAKVVDVELRKGNEGETYAYEALEYKFEDKLYKSCRKLYYDPGVKEIGRFTEIMVNPKRPDKTSTRLQLRYALGFRFFVLSVLGVLLLCVVLAAAGHASI